MGKTIMIHGAAKIGEEFVKIFIKEKKSLSDLGIFVTEIASYNETLPNICPVSKEKRTDHHCNNCIYAYLFQYGVGIKARCVKDKRK